MQVRRWWEKKVNWGNTCHMVKVLCLFVSSGKQINSVWCLFFILYLVHLSRVFFFFSCKITINNIICDPVCFLCHECSVAQLVIHEEWQLFVFPAICFIQLSFQHCSNHMGFCIYFNNILLSFFLLKQLHSLLVQVSKSYYSIIEGNSLKVTEDKLVAFSTCFIVK